MDPVSDMLNRIRTASAAGLPTASFDASNLKLDIAEALKKSGYLRTVTKKGKKIKKTIEVDLVYKTGSAREKEPQIKGLERVSKSSRRVYRKANQIRLVRQGFGSGFYSTSSGIMTDREARSAKMGGEYLFKIW